MPRWRRGTRPAANRSRNRGASRSPSIRGGTGNSTSHVLSSKVENQPSLDDSDIPEERYFLNPDAVSQHLFCPICQEIFNNPYRAPCGHSYCRKCITGWLNNAKNCPVDRQTLHFHQMHHDIITENIIGDYTVACPWRPLGCMHIGPLCSLKDHKQKCPLNPKAMPTVMQKYTKDILEKTTTEMQEKALRSAIQGCSSNSTSQSCGSGLTSIDLLDEIMASIPDSEVENHMIHEKASTSGVRDAENRNDSENEGEHIPQAPEMPSLRMRLYMGGNDEERSTLCNFLEVTEHTPHAGDNEISSKRRRLV